MWMYSEKYRFGFGGQEKDDEVKGDGNSLDFGARIYNSRLGRWLSLDPLASEREWVSPYNYCQLNPIERIDTDGAFDELVITGSQADAEKATEDLQKKTTLKLSRDPSTGKISAAGTAKTEDDKKIEQIVNDPTIRVNVIAANSNSVSYGGANVHVNGGGFMGNIVTPTTATLTIDTPPSILGDEGKNNTPKSVTTTYNAVEATQIVNPDQLRIWDAAFGKSGDCILHEVSEAYIGAQIAQLSGVSNFLQQLLRTILFMKKPIKKLPNSPI